ncbi:MAG: hypothetical protein DMG74_10775 [Acidobacteria bacterium]|nr:MAG: hypothetical protein DMG74_10775 [Acidobacteriota bacterium]
MLNNPGAANELSAATMVNATGEPLSVPDPLSWLVGIVVIEAELTLAAMLAVNVAATASFVGGACTLAFGGDARSGRLLHSELSTTMNIYVKTVPADSVAR